MKTRHINALCLLIIALFYIITNTGAAPCSAYFGPSGAKQCIKISGFTDYQWATCRTDSYIRSVSGGRHHCTHRLHTYCLYHCMLDRYERESGVVYSDCRCTPVSTTSPTPASTSSPVKTGQCNGYFGPSGARECVKLSRYTDYQWATCRTDSYLKSTSGGKHHCLHPLHTYCWYQCMLDKYERDSGVVYSSCRCTPVSTTSPSPPASTSSRSPTASTSSPLRTDQCNAYFGPNGARRCIKIHGFTDYQWATCRRDSYLKSTSGGRHHCANQHHIYCWYQCMLEKYEEENGDVSSSCRCTPGENSASQKKSSLWYLLFLWLAAVCW